MLFPYCDSLPALTVVWLPCTYSEVKQNPSYHFRIVTLNASSCAYGKWPDNDSSIIGCCRNHSSLYVAWSFDSWHVWCVQSHMVTQRWDLFLKRRYAECWNWMSGVALNKLLGNVVPKHTEPFWTILNPVVPSASYLIHDFLRPLAQACRI